MQELPIPLDFLDCVSNLDPTSFQYFDCLFNYRTIILNDEIDTPILETVILPLLKFEKDDISSPVTLILNTPGGAVSDGLTLCNIIDNYKKPLEIIVPSYACSMGTIILCSGNKNPNVTKKCYPFSFALFHSGLTVLSGESTSVEDTMNFNKDVDERIKQYVIANTNITEEEYMSHHRKQWFINSSDMKRFGLVDEIIGEPAQKEETDGESTI